MKYATSKDMKALTEAVEQLTKRILEMAQWQAYHSIEADYIFNQEQRKQILELNKNNTLLEMGYKELFRKYPPIFSVDTYSTEKRKGET